MHKLATGCGVDRIHAQPPARLTLKCGKRPLIEVNARLGYRDWNERNGGNEQCTA